MKLPKTHLLTLGVLVLAAYALGTHSSTPSPTVQAAAAPATTDPVRPTVPSSYELTHPEAAAGVPKPKEWEPAKEELPDYPAGRLVNEVEFLQDYARMNSEPNHLSERELLFLGKEAWDLMNAMNDESLFSFKVANATETHSKDWDRIARYRHDVVMGKAADNAVEWTAGVRSDVPRFQPGWPAARDLRTQAADEDTDAAIQSLNSDLNAPN